MLCDGVGRGVHVGGEGERGGDIDYLAAALSDHYRYDEMAQIVDGLELQIHDSFPLLVRKVRQRRGKVRARVVDEHVDAAEPVQAFVHAALPVVGVGQVALQEKDAPSALLDRGPDLADIAAVVRDEDICARLGESDGIDHSETGIGAGDHGHLALAGKEVERE